LARQARQRGRAPINRTSQDKNCIMPWFQFRLIPWQIITRISRTAPIRAGRFAHFATFRNVRNRSGVDGPGPRSRPGCAERVSASAARRKERTMSFSRFLLGLFLLSLVAQDASAGIFGKHTKPNPAERVPELLTTLKTDQDESKRAKAAAELRDYDPSTFP